MSIAMCDVLVNKLLWRFVGFGSSIVGFSCYALSPSFKNLFGEWNLLKIIVYSVVSFMFSGFILFVNRWKLTRSSALKANVCFLVLMVTSVYSFYQDKSVEGKAEKGYGRMLSLISWGAFALMSLSLSRQIQLKFELGMFNFFLGCVMVMAVKMNIKFALGAAAFCYVLISIRSCFESQLENQVDTQHVIIDIDNTSHQQVDPAVLQYMDMDVLYDSDVDSVESPFDEKVFVSYAGKDTFANNLVSALRRRNVKTYASNKESKICSRRAIELLMRIEGSHVSLIIFSTNYVNSKWRLTELSKIMECKRRYEQIVITFFQDIDLMEVNNQKRSYLDAFAKHEQSFDKKTLQRWKDDLTEAINLPNSWNLFLPRHNMEDTYFVEAIAKDLESKIDLSHNKVLGSYSGYMKHDPPVLNDEVWELEKIGKDGSFHKRLNKAGIHKVEDFLELVVGDFQTLCNILGSGMSNKMSDIIVERVLGGKLYAFYPDDSRNDGVVFNKNYELSGFIADGQYYSVDCLSDSSQRVSEEVERGLAKLGLAKLIGSSSPKHTKWPDGRNLQLHFWTSLYTTLFTDSTVRGEEDERIYILLIDANTGHVVTSGPESSLKLDVVVLKGDFNNEDDDNWSEEEFESHIVKERKGRIPLLTGDLQVTLEEGVGTLGELTFTDSSRWTTSGKFRLGLKVATGFCEGMRIREAKTGAFRVKNYRGKSFNKLYPPALKDEVWRLERIAKDGYFNKRLNEAGIRTVGDFLRLVVRDPQGLRNILGDRMSNRTWDIVVEHAKMSVLGGKLYVYYTDDSSNVGVVFNEIYKLSGLVANGQYYSADCLSDSQKVYAETLTKKAYENRIHVKEYDGLSLINYKLNKDSDSSEPQIVMGSNEYSNILLGSDLKNFVDKLSYYIIG